MAVDPNEILAFATQLSRTAQSTKLTPNVREVIARSAISRAYYAVFHAADQASTGYRADRPEDVGIHEELWDYYKSGKSEGLRDIGTKGDSLRARRAFADYKIARYFDPKQATYAVRDAEELLKLIASY